MEERKITEKESLDLISQMIRSSRQNMNVASGNPFLYWGYTTTILGIVIFALVQATGNANWTMGWYLMFVAWLIFYFINKNKPKQTKTYIDKAIGGVWNVIGAMFVISTIVMFSLLLFISPINFSLMLPLSLMFCSLGTAITGVILREKWLFIPPIASVSVSIVMLIALTAGERVTTMWFLYFSLSYIAMMIIPGHILNHKAKKNA